MNTPLDNPSLETAVADAVARIEVLIDLEQRTGVDASFTIRKELNKLPKALRVHVFSRLADHIVVSAKNQPALAILSGNGGVE